MREPELKEFCGVSAIYRAAGDAAPLVHRSLFALQHRGQEAAGIVTVDDTGRMHQLRARGLVTEALPLPKLSNLPGRSAIGHVRYSTVAADRAENVQPFLALTPYGEMAVAHNGNLKNADELAAELRQAGSLLTTTMDTELLVHLVARSGAADWPAALRYAASRVLGAYSLTMVCAGRLYGLRDAHGLRPLVLGELLEGGWVLASETCALDAIGARFVRDVAPGELVEIGPQGVTAQQLLPPMPVASPCVFELVYFARPDSIVFGQNVQSARSRMGEQLAEQDVEASLGPPEVDLVVPVPDSGIPAAIGYARRSGVPYERAILRSHYFGRTFILPVPDARAQGVRLKLSVNRELVAGKSLLLVDDSLVRGNTAREIVRMVREAGARAIHLRIASPPLRWPCYLGIDMPSREELIMNEYGSEEGVASFIGVDSLRYLSEQRLRAATADMPACMACMNGSYPL
jgi:amidophosphoribosyltransferase